MEPSVVCQSDYFLSSFINGKSSERRSSFSCSHLKTQSSRIWSTRNFKKSKLGLEWITGHCFQISFLRFEILKVHYSNVCTKTHMSYIHIYDRPINFCSSAVVWSTYLQHTTYILHYPRGNQQFHFQRNVSKYDSSKYILYLFGIPKLVFQY